MDLNFSEQTWRPKTSVKLRFALVQGIFIAGIIAFMALALYFPVKDRLVQITNSSYENLAYTLAPSIFNFYQTDQKDGLINAVHRSAIQQGVKYILVVNNKNIVYYDTVSGSNSLTGKYFKPDNLTKSDAVSKGDVAVGIESRDGVDYYNYVAPFISNNAVLYTVRIGVDQKIIDGEFYQLTQIFLYLGAFGIVIGIIAAYILAARLTKPIIQLTESALAIRAGNLNAYPEISTNDELEQLSREFQNMVEKLKSFYFHEYMQKKEAVDAKKRLEEINTRLEKLDSQKTDFLNAASHQLRTPLSVIHWSLSMIVEEMDHMNLKKDQQELLQESLKSTKRMVDLVNDLLDISRIEQGRRQMNWAMGNYGQVCDSLVKALQPLAQNKNLELSYFKDGEIEDSIIDEKSIYQVFNNFVDNAIKYTASGYVKLSCRQDGEKVIVKISDSGIGMTDAEKENLFVTRFSRGEDAQKMFPNGSGLGMFVANSLLQQHGGQVDVESEKGKGTTFILTLPIYHEAPAEDNFEDDTAQIGQLNSEVEAISS